MSRHAKRKIIVDGVEYTWQYGRVAIVIRRDGAIVGKPTVAQVTGETWSVIEHDAHKENFHLTPKHIAEWIGDHLSE